MKVVKQPSGRFSQAWLKSMAIAGAISLASCGGGGGTSTPVTTDVSGLVEAPNGQIALFKEHQSMLVALTEAIFPGAYAAITGLDPVTGATVELIRVDNNGVQIGDVLASTVTSVTGNYSLSLPSGVDFSGDLVLRITGNGGASMSAQVVEQSVDINPISQYILDKFIEDGTALDTLAVNEVVALTGRVEEFDLTATADLSTMLDQLEAEVGQFVDSEITVINSTPGDGTLAAGSWSLMSLSVGFHDSDNQGGGTFAFDVISEKLTLTDGGSGSVDLSVDSTLIDAFTNFNVDAFGSNIYHEVSGFSAGDNETFSGNIDANGNLAIPFPFEEDLQTTDLLVDPDGPDFGWRYPPGNFYVEDTGNGNVKLAINQEAGVRYETTDTNTDGVKDAIDPAKRSGDEISIEMAFLIKEGSGMGVSSLNGEYGMISYQLEANSATNTGTILDTMGIVSFNGGGNFAIAANAENVAELSRGPATFPNVTLTYSAADDASTTAETYTVSATGAVDIASGGLEAQVSSDGNLIVGIQDEILTTNDNGTPADPSDDFITEVNSNIHIMSKLGSGMQNIDLANSTYALRPLILGGNNAGNQFLYSLSSDSTMVFDATGDNVEITASDRGIERSSDIAEITAIPVEAATPLSLPVALSGKGEFTMQVLNPSDEDITIDGYVSADKTMFIARLYVQDNVGSDKDLGLVIGVKQ